MEEEGEGGGRGRIKERQMDREKRTGMVKVYAPCRKSPF